MRYWLIAVVVLGSAPAVASPWKQFSQDRKCDSLAKVSRTTFGTLSSRGRNIYLSFLFEGDMEASLNAGHTQPGFVTNVEKWRSSLRFMGANGQTATVPDPQNFVEMKGRLDLFAFDEKYLSKLRGMTTVQIIWQGKVFREFDLGPTFDGAVTRALGCAGTQ